MMNKKDIANNLKEIEDLILTGPPVVKSYEMYITLCSQREILKKILDSKRPRKVIDTRNEKKLPEFGIQDPLGDKSTKEWIMSSTKTA